MADETPPQRQESELLAERREKLERMRADGVDPFPPSFGDRVEIAEVRAAHDDLEPGEETDARYRVAGRITARRGHGRAAFLDLRDRSGQIQLHSRADVLGEARHDGLVGLDLGDIAGVEGVAFKTKKGELSLRVEDWTLLAKALRPLPDKHHGLQDVETRYRRRELDLIANPEVRELFALRARTIAAVRGWLDERGFLEVETPVLQPLYGGALARPFTTHHNALDRDLYLRIATELYLKRCIVGGIDRVYELGKDFRNEGISQKHNPEFTMLEWYEAYADYGDAAERTEELVAFVAERVLGTTTIERDGQRIDLAPPWRRLTLRDAIRERTGLDLAARPSRDELAAAIDSKPGPDEGWGKLVDRVLSKVVEPELTEPTFLLDYPVELSPFAKRHRTDDGFTERWEAFVGGIEIANAFTELNDPDEQRRRFDAQREELARGDAEAQPFDEPFLEALEQGMPPTGGVGLGIDRLVMLLTGARSLREVVLFPAMRT
ncbi:MAG: lysine--tRNA ligase [Solirubrobacterales bacterium]